MGEPERKPLTEIERAKWDAYINATDDDVMELTIREKHQVTREHDPDVAGSYYFRDMKFLLDKLDETRAEVKELKARLGIE